MNTLINKTSGMILGAVFFVSLVATPARAASPWAQETTYEGKTKGKLEFGLKNTLFGWMAPWAESKVPKYKTEWEGFSVGIGKVVVDTAAGIVQLATFFVPVDFPDIGYGLPIPSSDWHPVMFQKAQKGKVPAAESK